MKKNLTLCFLMFLSYSVCSQVIGRIDKRTKEFYIHTDLNIPYRVFGYQLPSTKSTKYICISSHAEDVAANSSNCKLGAYFDTGKLGKGDRIVYLGSYGPYGKMQFIDHKGKKTLFYLSKSCFRIR